MKTVPSFCLLVPEPLRSSQPRSPSPWAPLIPQLSKSWSDPHLTPVPFQNPRRGEGRGSRARTSHSLARSCGERGTETRPVPPHQAPAKEACGLSPLLASQLRRRLPSPGVDEHLAQGRAEQDDAGAAEGGPALLLLLHRVARLHLRLHEPHGQEEGVSLLHSAGETSPVRRARRTCLGLPGRGPTDDDALPEPRAWA